MSEITEYLNNRKNISQILNNPTYKMIFNKEKFIEPEVYFFEHEGMNIDAIFEAAYEEDTRGYICHRLNLVHDKKYIGYLKVFYIPQDVFEKMNPDLQFKSFQKRLTIKNINQIAKDFSFIVDGSDNFRTRFLINDYCLKTKKILVKF